MTTFDDREKAFENRYAHDQELAFKAEARRARQIGLWAAALIGKSPADAAIYAEDLVATGVAEGGSTAIVERLKQDLSAAGKPMSDHQIYREMNHALSEAIEQLMIE